MVIVSDTFTLPGHPSHYLPYPGVMNWTDAQDVCHNLEGHLAEFVEDDEVVAMKNYLTQTFGKVNRHWTFGDIQL